MYTVEKDELWLYLKYVNKRWCVDIISIEEIRYFGTVCQMYKVILSMSDDPTLTWLHWP